MASVLHRVMARVVICGTARSNASTSRGWSISSPIPGSFRIVGSMPIARAAARCGKRLSSPKRSGTASGGEHTPRWSRVVMRGHDGEATAPAARPVPPRFRPRSPRDVARHGQHRRPAFLRAECGPRRQRAGMAIARTSVTTRAPWRAPSASLPASSVLTRYAGQRAPRPAPQQLLEHRRASARGAAAGARKRGEALLRASQLLRRHRRPDAGHAQPVAPQPARRRASTILHACQRLAIRPTWSS